MITDRLYFLFCELPVHILCPVSIRLFFFFFFLLTCKNSSFILGPNSLSLKEVVGIFNTFVPVQKFCGVICHTEQWLIM